ncbi:hypothetical protein HLK59_01235 [Streptomyces sp. S3(2020)]|uniref:hypothetical protein n=1 Tax=Streptomyces sp. S3(2020) TaxID=2732044 RepID=UPI0014892AAD|nr:hypothetical protein [Streptomyces sp. S3(2020)]NNN28996.1 hypothetical protein [Streptomyces sp. S3(2020)]
MRAGLKISAFAAALAATFGTAYGVGQGIDPLVTESAPEPHASHEEAAAEGAAASPAGGLQVSEGGYALDLRTPSVTAGQRSDLRFVIRDSAGRAVTAYERENTKELHLIIASRDLGTYRHVHPARGADGTWSIPVELPRAGGYRVLADFTPAKKGAENLTLGADLAVAGAYEPRRLPEATRTVDVDGYQVRLTGGLTPGTGSELELTVARDGRPVTDLQPYLGSYGHLVALRSGDLAYLHVHPHGRPEPGPDVSFEATAPSSGTYRLFLDFKHDGQVRTAAFTVTAGAVTPGADTDEAAHGH